MDDPELAKFVDYALDIKKSGRWAAMNDVTKRLATSMEPEDNWRLIVFSSLCYKVFSEYLHLEAAYAEKQRGDVSLLAWRARNLLELSIWSIYCCESEQNAHCLYEDAGRDGRELLAAFEKWGGATGQPVDWIREFAKAKQDLSKQAADLGVENLDQDYKKVSDAARSCGMENQYRIANKVLSKFAHPTAMQIISSSDGEKANQLRDSFFSQGCLFFSGAFDALERHQLQISAAHKSHRL